MPGRLWENAVIAPGSGAQGVCAGVDRMPVFAFTDIEGSTGLWEKHQDAMGPVIARHYAILDDCVPRHGGKIIKKTGDGIFALFPDEAGAGPSPALVCALELQRRFQAEPWPVVGELRVRMGLHCGHAEEMAGDYYGPTANRTARFMSLGWGGQILVSGDLHKRARLPPGAEWVDLGVHQVKDLPEPQPVFGLTHPDLALRQFPPLKSLTHQPNNLPESLSPLLGRQRDLRAVASLLAGSHSRLITLLGDGGVGKSRLAVQAGLANLAAFKHGAWLASLADLGSAAGLAARVAEALQLGLYRQQEPRAQLLDYLKDKQLLLLLDPCERWAGQLGLVSELLEACPGLRVLACSRRRLALRGESVLEIKGLDVPALGSDQLESSGSVRLFEYHVRAFQPGFSVKPAERGHLLRVCRALQGLPLGLELAAEWLRQIPLKELAERLEQDPRFLASARTDRPPSQRSLGALFDASWGLLSAAEQTALARLTVFQGGFTPAAALQVCRSDSRSLAGLADMSLLDDAGDGHGALPLRHRAFARAKLDADPDQREQILDEHARYFCAYAKERERGLQGYDQRRALLELRQDYGNLQRAWDRAVERVWVGELGQAVRTLGLFADLQGLARDWEPRLDKALALWGGTDAKAFVGLAPPEAQAALAGLLAAQANGRFSAGRGAEALELMQRSLGLARKAGERSGAAYALVRLAVFMGPEDERRRPALEEAAALFEALGDTNGVAWARRNLGYLLCRQGEAKAGRAMVEESLAVFRELKNQRETAWCLNSLGQLDQEAGQAEAGARNLEEARDLFLGLGDLENAAWTLSALGRAAMRRRDWAEAKPLVEESLRLFGQLRHFKGRAQTLRALCEIHAGLGDLKTAFRALDQVISDAQLIGDGVGQAGALLQKGQLLARQDGWAEAAEDALGLMQEAQAAFAKAGNAQGQGLALEAQAGLRRRQRQAGMARGLLQDAGAFFAQAGAHDGEARVQVRIGDLDAAEGKGEGGEGWYKKCLRLSRQHKLGDYTVGALLGLAVVQHKQGRKLEALQLALVAGQALAWMPVSEAEFHEELAARATTVLGQVGLRLLQSLVDEAREKLAKDDIRARLKEAVAQNAV